VIKSKLTELIELNAQCTLLWYSAKYRNNISRGGSLNQSYLPYIYLFPEPHIFTFASAYKIKRTDIGSTWYRSHQTASWKWGSWFSGMWWDSVILCLKLQPIPSQWFLSFLLLEKVIFQKLCQFSLWHCFPKPFCLLNPLELRMYWQNLLQPLPKECMYRITGFCGMQFGNHCSIIMLGFQEHKEINKYNELCFILCCYCIIVLIC